MAIPSRLARLSSSVACAASVGGERPRALGRRERGELSQAHRADGDRAERRCEPLALLELPPRTLRVARQTRGGALQVAGPRPPRAVLRLELGEAGRVRRHLRHAVLGDRRAQESERRLDGRRPVGERPLVRAAGRRRGPALDGPALDPETGPRRRERERRVPGDLLLGERGEPAEEHRPAPPAAVPDHVGPDEVSGPLHVPRGECVPDRLLRLPVRGVPVAGAAVELELEPGLGVAKPAAQHLCEQRVVAVPDAVTVERDEEQVRPLQLVQLRGRAGLPEDRVAERSGEAVEHGRAREEPCEAGREARDHLVAEVVGDDPVVPGEALHRDDAAVSPERQRGEVQPRGPAFGPLGDQADLGRLELDPGAAEEDLRLVGGEREIGGAELEQAPSGAQLPERQGRLAAGGDRELRSGRQMPRQGDERVERLGRGEHVGVVEHQHERARPGSNGLAEAREHDALDGGALRRQGGEDRAAERLDPVERQRHVRQQRDRIVVAGVERDPGERALVRICPVSHQRRLAVPGGGGDVDDRVACGGAEPVDEAVARDEPGTAPRRLELRLERRESRGRGLSSARARLHGCGAGSHLLSRLTQSGSVRGRT